MGKKGGKKNNPDDLKTCPFCGGDAEMIFMSKMNIYIIQCSSPKCRINPSTDPNQSRAVVIRAWNKRAH